MVIDFRKVNLVPTADRYPIPDINEELSQLRKNKYFSVMDGKSTFSFNNGEYEFTLLSFGLGVCWKIECAY